MIIPPLYIDPFAGSIWLQALIAGALGGLWRLAAFFRRRRRSRPAGGGGAPRPRG